MFANERMERNADHPLQEHLFIDNTRPEELAIPLGTMLADDLLPWTSARPHTVGSDHPL